MGAVVPLVAAVAGYGASAAIGGGIVGALGGFLVSTAINQIGGRALSKKPKAPAFTTEAAGRTQVIRSAVESHKVVYGQAKVSGPLVFAKTVDTGPGGNGSGSNKYLHLIVPLAAHEVEEIGTVYLNDVPLTNLDGSGFVLDTPYGKTTTTTNTVTLSYPISSASRTAGIITANIDGAHGFLVGESVTIGGALDGAYNNTFTILSVPSASSFTYAQAGGGEGTTTPPILSARASVTRTTTTTTTTSYARVKKHLGGADQTADPDLVAECGLTADHRLRGIAYVYVRLEYNADVFPLGIPNISAVVKGKKVYDPRTGLTQWSANAALCIRDYLAEDYGFACDSDEINNTYAIAAANVCDESVALTTGGSQARYTCNGVVDTATAPLDNLQALVTSIAGAVTYVQGKFRIHPAAYDTPSGDIPTSALAGDVEFSARPSRKELFNAVKGTYVAPEKNWQPTDFPPVTNALYETQDNGEQIPKDIELPFTTHPEAAQRLAKIILEKGRQGITVTLPVNHSALQYAVYDVVTLTNAQLGWSAKPFRITRWSMGTPGPITLTLQEESAASYDWNSGEATTIDAAPDTTLPNPWDVDAPGIPAVTESLYETRDSAGVKAKATITWAASPSPFVHHYVPEYRVVGATGWTVLPNTTDTTADVFDITPGRYEMRVKAVSNLGAASDYATANPKEIFGLGARPADISGLTLQTVSSLAVLRWDQPAELDVRIGGRILVRHSEDPTGATWESSYSIGEPLPGASNMAVVPLKAGTYLVKAEDSSGLTSVNAATFATKNASVLAFSNLATVQEDALFSGTHSGTFAEDGILKLSGAGYFDDISDFDAVNSLDAYGGVRSTGTYTFASGTDLGAVTRVRLETSLDISAVNINDMVDSRYGIIDDWLDFDGTLAGGSVDAWVEARETDDNPSGTPTWGDWRRIDAADVEAWGIQYRAVLTSTDPAYNVNVSRLRVSVKEVT